MNVLNANTTKYIGQQIRSMRKKNSWSQKKLADLTGLDRTTIGMLERDDYSDIGIRKIIRVLEILGKSLSLVDYGLPTLDHLLQLKGKN
ncbi:MAG: helix-turn-helix domain-containing protein [Proteobacteria bacterium]|nr:helix-turn-helix domain-containing protein [Pseudomonadota bacterium]